MFFFKERSLKEEIETEDRINFSLIQQKILEFLKLKEYYIDVLSFESTSMLFSLRDL
ncbi:hypothetical protein D3C76_1871810 [compost metagenome]